jgi:cysteine desulfurase/selenocysteine lyase
MNTMMKKIRSDFPIFHAKPDWTYLDNAATAQVPQVVIDAISQYHYAYRAPVHRGLYKEAVRVTEVYEESRALMARFLNASCADEIIFTSGATGASNMLVYMLEHSVGFQPGDEIITTPMEHHSALIPLQQLALRKNLALKYIPLHSGFTLRYADSATIFSDRTRIVSVTLASNVTGVINNVRRFARMAHAQGALVLCDATAVAGHRRIDVRELEVDFLYFSGHKMCGPTGVGVLYGKREQLERLQPGYFGGGIVEEVTRQHAEWTVVPHRFEAGTPNISGVIGLGSAVTYLEMRNLGVISEYVQALVARAQAELGAIPGVHLFSAKPERNVGIVSFVLEGVHPHDVAEIASRHNVAIRAGHHCALPFHEELGVSATVRASFYLYNTMRDVEVLVRAVKDARKIFA